MCACMATHGETAHHASTIGMDLETMKRWCGARVFLPRIDSQRPTSARCAMHRGHVSWAARSWLALGKGLGLGLGVGLGVRVWVGGGHTVRAGV